MSKARATLKITGVTLLAAILAPGIYEGIKLRQAHGKLDSVFAPYRTAEAKTTRRCWHGPILPRDSKKCFCRSKTRGSSITRGWI